MDINEKIRIAGIVNDSIVDGPGFRLTVFVQGCPHRCKGCHNPQTHDFSGGEDITIGEVLEKIKANPLLDGVTFSGGEPFCQAEGLAYLAELIKAEGLNVISYTGYTFEYLRQNENKENGYGRLLRACDYLIDGPFILAERDLTLKFRGSANQRIIDVQTSLAVGSTVIADL